MDVMLTKEWQSLYHIGDKILNLHLNLNRKTIAYIYKYIYIYIYIYIYYLDLYLYAQPLSLPWMDLSNYDII